jgi:hypothetical protein
MKLRPLYARACPQCGKAFTTGDKDSTYCSKSCSAKARVARLGMPLLNIRPSIEALKGFRRA